MVLDIDIKPGVRLRGFPGDLSIKTCSELYLFSNRIRSWTFQIQMT
jgi:hypothetical protein